MKASRSERVLVSSFFVLFSLALADVSEGQVKRLTVDETVALALEHSPRIDVAMAQIDEAVAKQKVVRGRFLPVVQVQAHAMYFNEPAAFDTDMDFAFPEFNLDPESLPVPESTYDAELLLLLGEAFGPMAEMGETFSGFEDAFSGNQYDIDVSVNVIQPLTPLYQVALGYRLAGKGIDAARVGRERQAAEVELKARATYFQVLQTRAGLKALSEAATTVEAHVARAKAFEAQDLIGRQDVLEAEVRLAQLQGRLSSARHAAELTQTALAIMVGFHEDTPLELVEPGPPDVARIEAGLDDLRESAISNRPETRELRLRLEQAEGGVSLARAAFIPDLSIMGSYHYNEGSLMIPPAWTVGAVFSWTLWEWGASYYGIHEARARVSAVRAGLDGLEQGIRLQVRQALLASREALEQIDITQRAIVLARENLRLEQVRFEHHHAATTDVLDAQMRLTQAQVEHDVARYGLHIAIANLRHVSGQLGERE